ncbi:MAG: hypothetical protein M3042_00880 [Actinomycetota bacterium]|nr:hypothetical protein [Actinomycetota bacterium]
MSTTERLRELFLAPEPQDKVEKPSRQQLRALPRAERRRTKVEYAAQAGRFRTWVYAAALVLIVGAFALYVVLVSP